MSDGREPLRAGAAGKTDSDAYERFLPFYDAWSAPMQDRDFWVRRARDSGGPVLELAAGHGRVAIPIAQAGIPVVAVDLSPAMLEEGRRRAKDAGADALMTFVEADMRDYVSDRTVPLAIVAYHSFHHLLTTADQLITLGNVRESLAPGGVLILSMLAPDPFYAAENHGRRRHRADIQDEQGRTVEIWSTAHYDNVNQLITLNMETEAYRDGRLVEESSFEMELRMIYRFEMEHLLARTGFAVEAIYGDFDEGPFGDDCKEMIWVARSA